MARALNPGKQGESNEYGVCKRAERSKDNNLCDEANISQRVVGPQLKEYRMLTWTSPRGGHFGAFCT